MQDVIIVNQVFCKFLDYEGMNVFFYSVFLNDIVLFYIRIF